jgi:hypothetical protein
VNPGVRRFPGPLWRWPWYAAVLPLAFVLDLGYEAGIMPAGAVRAIIVALGAGVVITLIAVGLLRDRDRGGAVAGLVIAASISVRVPAASVLALAGLLPILIDRLRRERSMVPWPRFTFAANIVGGLLLAMVSVKFVLAYPLQQANAAQGPDVANQPDIYLILLDGHARPDVLSTLGHDMTKELRAFEDLGFDVVPGSRSNAMITRFALPILLNMKHLDQLGVVVSGREIDRRETVKTIFFNEAFEEARRAGYEVNVFSSGYDDIAIRSADRFHDGGHAGEYERTALMQTVAGLALTRLDPAFGDEQARARTRWTLDALPQLAAERSNRPRLFFAHIAQPHPPYVFFQDCGRRDNTFVVTTAESVQQRSPELILAEEKAVVEQTICVDQLVLESTGRLLDQASRDAVVVIFSDHGPDVHVDWDLPDQAGVNERVPNLLLARTPGHPNLFGDDATLVNILPTVFDTYLGTRIGAQPDVFWIGPDVDGTIIRAEADLGGMPRVDGLTTGG